MIHLGDITKIHGDQIEPVYCITFGSPCQDLSIAGRRAGLAGERSGLFMEAVRIIKEMRRATHGSYPVVVIWENVPGAFSSNGGEDFRAVLEELARVEEPDASIPRPPRGGRWSKAGAIAGNGWSLAWRQLDAQYWGVPQRRKRIALVVDFAGGRAGEILFERESLPGHPDQSIPTWQEATRTAGNRPTGNDRMVGQQGGQAYTLKIRSGCAGGGKGALVQTEKTGTLSTLQDQTLFQPVYCLAGNIIDRSETAGANGSGVKENQSYTLNTVDRPAVAYKVFDARGNGDGKTVPTITGDHESRVTDYTAILTASYGVGNGQTNVSASKETSGTLTTMHDPQAVALEYRRERLCAGFAYKAGAKANGIGYEVEKMGTLYAERHDAAVIEKTIQWIVRRLTPTECERLQGYPDGWTDIGEWTDTKGKKHKAADSPRYKALGNSIALPQWFWIAQKMKQYLPAGATLGSLFDGIGGFPLVWETTYGKGTARWASEIEEFPIAVTKRRFGNDSENKGDSGTVLCGGNCQCHKSCGDAETH